jgi:hypothetical protein
MGFSFRSTGRAKRAEECWNESHAINESQHAAKTKEKPAGLREYGGFGQCPRGMSDEI